MRRRFYRVRPMQTQNEEIGLEGAASLQDLLAGGTESDQKLNLHFRRDTREDPFSKLRLAVPLRPSSHLQESARHRPMKALRYRGFWKHMKNNEAGSEMMSKYHRVRQTTRGARAEIGSQ